MTPAKMAIDATMLLKSLKYEFHCVLTTLAKPVADPSHFTPSVV